MSSSNRVFKKIRSGSKTSLFIEGLIKAADHGTAKTISTIGSMKTISMALKRECPSCGNSESLNIDETISEFGEDTPLTDIKKPCPICGHAKTSIVPDY
jgi:ribosomal protein S27AE